MNHYLCEIMESKIEKDYANIAGIIVFKDGENVYEKYFHHCHRESCVHIYSVTKSILGILIGIAIEKGYIESVHQKILDFFPHYQINKKQKVIQEITMKDMLTMVAPYKKQIPPFNYIKYFMSDDWVNHTLHLIGRDGSIGTFNYRPLIGPDILSGILCRATGQSVFDFANEHLFKPLEIKVEKNLLFQSQKEQQEFNQSTSISGWAMDAHGTNAAGWGLSLSAMDMAKIGQCLLNQGMWNHQTIVPSQWIHESTRVHSRWIERDLAYGYLWWVLDEEKRIYAAMGDGGNVIYVNTQQQMVVSINSLFKNNVTDRLDFIQTYVVPAFIE